MIFEWPQITVLIIFGLRLGYSLAMNGKLRTEDYSFSGAVFSVSVWAGLLYAGGFWI